MSDDLDRFVTAQAGGVYEQALGELHRGRKTSHWMWFVFPQYIGLGRSATAQRYAIASLAQAEAYLAHPVLGPRLVACCDALLTHPDLTAQQILGGVDALKLRSSMTLFARAADDPAPFQQVLAAFYDGEDDPATLDLLDQG
ncbi:DUF1810 domain-containing protein [Nocardioides mangrovicus]|uniref:DUF1810 domain-containing protein n=1 Tax=Nocardioides mangrovicus TaxID=2478913 RepID=A0A3L8NZV4_9ACTN|nr:DUF1810 domain-containing protein [Nocardioides mangrovicus]RLV47839.1 DUF1810 domain-containing protein [Nocardioides mangrovicus]